MKVLFNTHPSAFLVPGGGEVQLLETRRALQARGVTVALFDPWRPRIEDHDVVHMFSAVGGAVPFHRGVRAAGVPLVLSPILWLGHAPERFPLAEIAELFALSDRVLPNSEAERRTFEALFDVPAQRYRVVPNAIDPDMAGGPGPEPFRRKHGTGRFVLCVGNVEPRKNQLVLARACRALGVPLVLVGGVRDADYLAACRRAGSPGLQHVGRLEHGSELLRSAYQACSVHALVSDFETPGLATLEAAALGAPVVSTERGSAREYLGEAAVYVCPDDPDDVCAGLRRALADPPDASGLPRRILARFTWDRVAADLCEVYASLAGGGAA